jgi:hypothetical protein
MTLRWKQTSTGTACFSDRIYGCRFAICFFDNTLSALSPDGTFFFEISKDPKDFPKAIETFISFNGRVC